jgi:phenylacetate-CoA ligase
VNDFTPGSLERLEPAERAERQAMQLGVTFDHAVRGGFYGAKLVGIERPRSLEDLARLPFTTKAELIADQAAQPPFGSVGTESLARYTRYCQTSSTTGDPLRVLDTNESWAWMLECWYDVFRAAHVGASDRILFPFSFGPFLGFWTAFEAGARLGALCVPGGGLGSRMRLHLIERLGATAICCTPTYALHLAEAHEGERPLAEGSVRVVIVAGEPGGSIAATRERIERTWGARVIDHHGLTELGPISFECWEAPGFLHLNEEHFLCEVLDPATGAPAKDGERGELVVTSLGRFAWPLLRYRTGDLVERAAGTCPCSRTFARLRGGILARADDMVNVRGVNVYPAAIEAVVRGFPEVVEFRSTVTSDGSMRALAVELETAAAVAGLEARVGQALREALSLQVGVRQVPAGTLPRFEMKARRFVVEG